MHEENAKSNWKQFHHLVKITRTTCIAPNYMKKLKYYNFTIDVAPKSSECYHFSKMMPFSTESNQFSIINRNHLMQIVTHTHFEYVESSWLCKIENQHCYKFNIVLDNSCILIDSFKYF